MKVLRYLKNKTLQNLNEEFSIKIKEYPDYNLAVLNYNQIDSPKFHPIVKECRGLIIDTKNLVPISRTFGRFYNVNENVLDNFMWDTPFRAEEKADGSLMSVYYHMGSWRIASRGNAFAEGKTATGFTFHKIFESIIETDINNFMKNMNPSLSYTFEMCSIHNKVVKIYKDSCLYLIGIHTLTEGELDCFSIDEVAKILDIKRPKVYSVKSMIEIHNSFKDFEPTEEGYVLIDEHYNRLKIKNPTYVDLHHLAGNGEITPKRITEVVFRGETEEVLGYFPEYREYFKPYQNAYNFLINLIEEKRFLVNDTSLSQKEFAYIIAPLYYKSVLFSLRKGLTIKEIFSNMGSNIKVQLLEKLIN